jgi:DNA-binding CsgD family transcriptional regulator
MPQPQLLAEELLGDAHRAVDLAAFRYSLMRRLVRLVDASSAAALPVPRVLGTQNDARGACVFHGSDSLFRYFLLHRERFYGSLNRAFDVLARADVALDTAIYTAEERARLDCYVEALIPAKISSILVLLLRFRGRASGIICLTRHAASPGFDLGDVERVRSLAGVVGMVDAAVTSRSDSPPGGGLATLSHREQQVAKLLGEGLQNKEIAATLGTSSDTVRKQTICIYEKTGVSGRVDLVARFGEALARLPLDCEGQRSPSRYPLYREPRASSSSKARRG